MVIRMNSSTFHKQILAALSLATVFAGGCVSVDATVPEMQLVQRGMEFPGVPVEVTGEVSVSHNFSYPHDPVELPEGVDSTLHTIGVSLIANSGIEDFSFLREMRITISDEVNAPFELASFERDDAAPKDGGVLVMKVNPEVDTLDAMKTESIGFVIDLSGSLPKVNWSMDIRIDMAGEVQYHL
jgi:hypothetical protein